LRIGFASQTVRLTLPQRGRVTLSPVNVHPFLRVPVPCLVHRDNVRQLFELFVEFPAHNELVHGKHFKLIDWRFILSRFIGDHDFHLSLGSARSKERLKFRSIVERCRGKLTQFSEYASKDGKVERGQFGEERFEWFRD
jgi:hypothetical protein